MFSKLLILLMALITFLSSSSPVVQGFSVLPTTTRTLNTVDSFSILGAPPPPPTRTTTSSSTTTTSTALFGKKDARAQGNERKNKTERVKKVKDDVIEVEAVVIESLPNAMFRCVIDGAQETQVPVLATISGKIRKNFVKILVGDKVTIELSPYDLTRGRITYRTR